VNIIEKESDTRLNVYSAGLKTETTRAGDRFPLKSSLTERIAKHRKPVRSVKNRGDADKDSVVLANMKDGFNTGLAVPLISQGEVLGSIQLRSVASNAYPESQVRFMTLVAEQFSGAMARSDLAESELVLALERERAESLESQNQDLMRLQQVREQFLGMVTHELRTPLTSISAFTDILGHNRDGTLTDRQFQQLNAVSRNATQLSELIDDLIHMSRMERGQFELIFDQADLVELVKQVCESMAPVMQHRGQNLKALIGIKKLRLHLDHSRMTQVMNNLISNASKFSPPESTVTVSMELLDDGVQIDVADEGTGIDRGEAEAVFDPLYRVESDNVKRVPGTGLGLHVARTIVRQHGGDITIVPGETSGSTLRITLPLEARG
jgi:signal transduction histidine kinase